MWIPETLVRELDHPGGRSDLAREATARLRETFPGVDIEVFWDGMWIRRVGPHYFPDPELFTAEEKRWRRWPGLAQKFIADADDYWFYRYKPSPGDVIVDVGAGRGEDVFAFSHAVGPAGRVWAIEPHPVSFAALQRFCALNGLANVRTLNFACVSEPADLQIETLPVWESNYVRAGEPSANSHSVRGVRLDELCAGEGITRVNFLKMNIEGAERDALPGASGMMQRVGSACVAAHDFRADRGEGEHFRTLAFVREFLASAGFETETREDPRYYVPYHVHAVRHGI
jgi:FkbM family methyltransferase